MADKLADALEQALADTFALYFAAHSCHWNVTGETFPALHEFFGSIYDDAFGAVDAIAERIRTLGVKAPTSVISLARMSGVENPPAAGCEKMVKALLAANEVVIASLSKAFAVAENAREVGLSNFLQDRLDRHAKWHWMLTATSEDED